MFETIKNNLIHKTAIINWEKVELGINNIIYPYSVIGFDAQHPTEKSDGIVKIGDNNIFREYTTVNLPTRFSYKTIIMNNCYFMEGAHIAHDCVVEDNVRISNKSVLSGHTYIMKNSVIGLGTMIHQFQVIGSYTMIGMNCVIDKKIDILPGYTYVGIPARRIKKNTIGLNRNSVTEEILNEEIERYKEICKKVRD